MAIFGQILARFYSRNVIFQVVLTETISDKQDNLDFPFFLLLFKSIIFSQIFTISYVFGINDDIRSIY